MGRGDGEGRPQEELIRHAILPEQPVDNSANPNTVVNATRQFAGFAAGLKYAGLPETVKDHLFCFLLDYLRVASLGQRMSWSAVAGARSGSPLSRSP